MIKSAFRAHPRTRRRAPCTTPWDEPSGKAVQVYTALAQRAAITLLGGGDMPKNTFTEPVDIQQLQFSMEQFYRATGLAIKTLPSS